jgi:hypothetical protein
MKRHSEKQVIGKLCGLLSKNSRTSSPKAATGACIINGGSNTYCAVLTQDACSQLGGVWLQGQDCGNNLFNKKKFNPFTKQLLASIPTKKIRGLKPLKLAGKGTVINYSPYGSTFRTGPTNQDLAGIWSTDKAQTCTGVGLQGTIARGVIVSTTVEECNKYQWVYAVTTTV